METNLIELADEICFGETSVSFDTNEMPEGRLAKVNFPIIMRLSTPTPDGRLFPEAGFSTRKLPLPLMFKDETSAAGGHDKAQLCGSLEEALVCAPGVVSGWGWLIDNPAGHKALQALKTKSMRGVSADLADIPEVVEPDGVQLALHPNLRMVFPKYAIAALTFCPIPAFPDAYGELEEPTGALVASAKIVRDFEVPREVFAKPKFNKPTGNRIGSELSPHHVYGYLALWDSCHTGLRGCRRPPRNDDLKKFYGNDGGVLCDNGEVVRTGPIFLGGDHPNTRLNGQSAMAGYAATSLAWADVVVGKDDVGIWYSGIVRPGVPSTVLHAARASGTSGDWRPVDGKLRLYAILSTNTRGFVIDDGGDGLALVAAGLPAEEVEEEEDLVETLESVELIEDEDEGDDFESFDDALAAASVAQRTLPRFRGSPATLADVVQVKSYIRNGRMVRASTRKGKGGAGTAKSGPAPGKQSDAVIGFYKAVKKAYDAAGLKPGDVVAKNGAYVAKTDAAHEKMLKMLKALGMKLDVGEDGSGKAVKGNKTIKFDASPGKSAWTADGLRTKNR